MRESYKWFYSWKRPLATVVKHGIPNPRRQFSKFRVSLTTNWTQCPRLLALYYPTQTPVTTGTLQIVIPCLPLSNYFIKPIQRHAVDTYICTLCFSLPCYNTDGISIDRSCKGYSNMIRTNTRTRAHTYST